ncbi:MAG: GNAT family N-acetyltransferase [Myxococcota bacterium]
MKIVPMTEDELAAYREHIIDLFAREKSSAEGVTPEEARGAAEAAWERANPEGNKDHVIGRLQQPEDVSVGVMWFAVRPEWGRPCAWLYDIMIDAEHRGQGLGRLAMALLEEEAHKRGAHTIGLHVFGHNAVARNLYQSLGFRETSVVMRKDLEP